MTFQTILNEVIEMVNNDISARQNSDENIMIIASQRQLYSDAKYISGLQLILCILFPISIPLLKTFCSGNSRYTALIIMTSIVLLLLNSFYFDKAIKQRKVNAVHKQELFDTNVFQLPWNTKKSGIKEESYKSMKFYYEKYLKKQKDIKPLTNWYPQEYSNVPIEVGRILCQNANLTWDKEVRTNYKWFLMIMFWISFATIIITSIIINNTFTNTLIYIFAPITPLLVYYGKCFQENENTINNMVLIKHKMNSLLENLSQKNLDKEQMNQKSREMQDDIFQHRCNTFLIPDWFYKLKRKKQEEDMMLIAKRIVEELKN
jgi:hypothetical protein